MNSTRLEATAVARTLTRTKTTRRPVESLAVRTLLSVARQRKELDAVRCQLVFEHLDTALSVRTALHRTLAKHHVSDLQFCVLVTLFALDPEPVMPADLADYTSVSRAAITDAVARLVSLGLVTRSRDKNDRRIFHVHLTKKGRATVDDALNHYLSAVANVARYVEPHVHSELLSAYERLHRGAAELAS